MICERCKFAVWDTTASGRKHPGGGGKCAWTKTFQIAGSAKATGSYEKRGAPITVTGGHIWRKRGDEFPAQCAVFQEV